MGVNASVWGNARKDSITAPLTSFPVFIASFPNSISNVNFIDPHFLATANGQVRPFSSAPRDSSGSLILVSVRQCYIPRGLFKPKPSQQVLIKLFIGERIF